jgi:hypothetical protein
MRFKGVVLPIFQHSPPSFLCRWEKKKNVAVQKVPLSSIWVLVAAAQPVGAR